jgi:uncharacterized membrane protein
LHEVLGPAPGIDGSSLEAAVREAVADPTAVGVLVEIRAYYVAHFCVADDPNRFTAVIGAGQGPVYAARLPSRSRGDRSSEKWPAVGLAALLIAEAILVPGWWLPVLAVVLTAAVASGVLLRTVVRSG